MKRIAEAGWSTREAGERKITEESKQNNNQCAQKQPPAHEGLEIPLFLVTTTLVGLCCYERDIFPQKETIAWRRKDRTNVRSNHWTDDKTNLAFLLSSFSHTTHIRHYSHSLGTNKTHKTVSSHEQWSCHSYCRSSRRRESRRPIVGGSCHWGRRRRRWRRRVHWRHWICRLPGWIPIGICHGFGGAGLVRTVFECVALIIELFTLY